MGHNCYGCGGKLRFLRSALEAKKSWNPRKTANGTKTCDSRTIYHPTGAYDLSLNRDCASLRPACHNAPRNLVRCAQFSTIA
jgi:hypothetical protein